MNQEDKILHLLKNGNKLGLELLFRQFYKPLVVYASKFVRTEQEAEDLVQEVFISFWEGDKFSSVQKYMRAYLYHSVKNKCLNYQKANGKIALCGIEDYANTLFESFPDDETFAEKVAAIKIEIEALPQRTRDIFMGVYFHKLSYGEVAEEFNISKNTVKTTLSRAMKTLRGRLSSEAFTLLLLLI
ncbi:RNA polymerase sigma factor [Carboxylicivirga taeanensis]|uniref:RNA polymerase sigma factor n=1 Tax=Carboxylicivirga taeanensis TaxID=1416875 RepID=UPI003F6DE341